MDEILKAVLLGMIQGVTEFLPISSSAHLLALEKVLDFHMEGLAFDVALHLATLLAVILYFRRDIIGIVRGDRLWAVTARLVLGTVPIGVLGFLLSSIREDISTWAAVGGWTFSAAYLLLTRGRYGETRHADLSLPRTFGVGLAQSLAIFPGVSRSGSTIAAGLWLGLTRDDAARFSFLLAIPAMLGAGLHEGLKLAANPQVPERFWVLCGAAVPVALVVGLLAIHVLLRIVRGSRFHLFGWYNLAAAAALTAYLVAHG